MAENTLTDLAADIYVAADKVGRELTGMIPAVTINSGSEAAAKDDPVRASFAPSVSPTTLTPAMTIPEGTGQVVANKTMTLDTMETVEIPWTGEGVKSVNNGAGFETVYGDMIAQAMRAHANAIETALVTAARAGACRAYGTAATTPFGTANDYTDASNVLKILKDNGAGSFDNQLVINTSAGANFLGKQSAVNSAGTDSILRQGVILDLAGMPVRESGQLGSHTAGTAASATTDATGYAIGSTTITLASAGTGTILAGDVITFAGDTNKYVVVTGDTDVSDGGTVVLQEPGLRKAIAAGATAITMVATHSDNLGFARSAVELAIRAPADPLGGDAAEDVMMVTDPYSGLAFAISIYKGRKKAMIAVDCLYGVKVWKPEHVALLIG
jgi:hypothetical protein